MQFSPFLTNQNPLSTFPQAEDLQSMLESKLHQNHCLTLHLVLTPTKRDIRTANAVGVWVPQQAGSGSDWFFWQAKMPTIPQLLCNASRATAIIAGLMIKVPKFIPPPIPPWLFPKPAPPLLMLPGFPKPPGLPPSLPLLSVYCYCA